VVVDFQTANWGLYELGRAVQHLEVWWDLELQCWVLDVVEIKEVQTP
jgi:hypothetical protein